MPYGKPKPPKPKKSETNPERSDSSVKQKVQHINEDQDITLLEGIQFLAGAGMTVIVFDEE